ncbi:hypothetical protein [Streptomyces goshikiensis]
MAPAVHRHLHTWRFAHCLASNDSHWDIILPSGVPAGAQEEALDCAEHHYLSGPAI